MSDRKKQIRSTLLDVCGDAGVEGKVIRTDDLVSAGIPRADASSIARASYQWTDGGQVVEACDEWADMIARRLDQQDALTPQQIIERVPRIS